MFHHKLSDEPARLASLKRYDVLDTATDRIFEKITALVSRVLKVPISAVSLVDSDSQWFTSIQGTVAKETPRPVSFCSHAITGVTPFVVTDAAKDERFAGNPLVHGPPYVRSYAGAPLQTPDGYNIGALCAIDTVPRPFGADELDLLTGFAALVVDGLELRRIAERDSLTHALSRRGFIGQMEKELKRFDRSQEPCVLAVMDLDRFKSINDVYGHPAGDAVLKDLAATCIFHLRATDVFGRLGGEEFGILFTGTDKDGARSAIEKIRRTIERQSVPVGDGIRVTASFGLATLGCETTNADDWIARAYEALYRAKHSGRNRCVFAAAAHQPSGAEIIRLEQATARRREPRDPGPA